MLTTSMFVYMESARTFLFSSLGDFWVVIPDPKFFTASVDLILGRTKKALFDNI